jgi:hypothetical protein
LIIRSSGESRLGAMDRAENPMLSQDEPRRQMAEKTVVVKGNLADKLRSIPTLVC